MISRVSTDARVLVTLFTILHIIQLTPILPAAANSSFLTTHYSQQAPQSQQSVSRIQIHFSADKIQIVLYKAQSRT